MQLRRDAFDGGDVEDECDVRDSLSWNMEVQGRMVLEELHDD